MNFDEIFDELKGIISPDGWSYIDIDHSNSCEENIKSIREFLKQNVGKANGIYKYTNNSGKSIYIGKGSPIINRLLAHYKASYKAVSGDTKYNLWHRFWSSKENKTQLKVYWKNVDEEFMRKISEVLLTKDPEPYFEIFRRD